MFQFHVLVFGRQACGFLVPRPGIEPVPPALGSKVLTTGRPGMSLHRDSLLSEPRGKPTHRHTLEILQIVSDRYNKQVLQ